MIRKFICLICVLLVSHVFGQTSFPVINLISDSGFELGNPPRCDFYSNECGGTSGCCLWGNGPNGFDEDLFFWDIAKINSHCKGSPDYYQPGICGDYSNNINSINPNQSKFVSLVSNFEAIRTGITKNNMAYNLIGGRKYVLRFDILGGGEGMLNVWFSKFGEHWYKSPSSSQNEKWNAINSNVDLSEYPINQWVTIERTFIAPFGENFDELNNLIFISADENNEFRVCLDNVYLFEENECTPTRLLENINHWSENKIYQANNILMAGNSVNPLTQDGPVIVSYNSNIIYRAGQQIILEPGFETHYGCYFEAVIGPCEENPCPSAPDMQQNYKLCNTTSAVLGPSTTPDVGLIYSWSPVTYLDNPASPNPVFTAPPGEGVINYTLTVTSACGYFYTPPFTVNQEVVFPISIYYNDNPDPNPSVALNNLQQSHLNFSVDLNVGVNTEKICISLTDISTSQTIATECFYAESDFQCCNFSFTRFDFSYDTQLLLDPCKDYLVSFDVNNKCDENIATESFIWNNSETFQLVTLPNVITPNSDGE